jgi:hypothetical protein
MPVVAATDESLAGYGRLVDDPAQCRVEIVRWPAQGHRPIDADTGDQGGTTEGVFVSEWQGDILYGRNEAVGGHYILAYAEAPEAARTDHAEPPGRMLLWHANYHPDGGQLFFPLDRRPFYVPLALPGDDVTPQRFVCFRFDGSQRPLHPPEHLARGRLRPARHAALLRPAGRGACARLGRLRARVRLPARSGDRVRRPGQLMDTARTPMHRSGASADPLPEVRVRAAPRRSLGLHPALRDALAHVLDRRRLPGLRPAVAVDPMPGLRSGVAAPAVVSRTGGQRIGPGARARTHRHLTADPIIGATARLQGEPAWPSNSTT